MNVTGWSNGLEVTGGGEGIVSHAGVALLRQLADKTGLTAGLSKALASPRLLIHDRGRVTADLACAIADGAEVISDFRVMTDQQQLFGPVASVPTAWRALDEIAAADQRMASRVTAAVNAARHRAWAQIEARHGSIPGIRIADKTLDGVIGIRLDATVTPAHSDKEGAEPNFKGFGHHPLLSYCDNTDEPLAGMLRPGSAGSNTAADHITVLDEAITALPPAPAAADGHRRWRGRQPRSDHPPGQARRPARLPGHLLRRLGPGQAGETAITQVPAGAWQIAVDARGEVRERRADDACDDRGCAHARCWREEAHVTELTGLLRGGPAGDQLSGWPASMRVFARRERPHPGAQLTLFEAEDGWRYSLWVTNLPAACAAGARTPPTSMLRTGCTHGSRTASVLARTPASGTSPPNPSPSTRRGFPSR